ncbi:16439_t:CDS:1, partial [Funneliformis caledonium]
MRLPPIQESGVFEDGSPLYRQSKYYSVEKFDGFINKFTNISCDTPLENFRGQGLKDERIVRVKLINLVKIIERLVDEIVLSKLKIDDLILA